MSIQSVQETVDELLKKALTAGNERLAIQYDYVADYYRLNAELPISQDKRKVVLNTLQSYPDVHLPIRIDEISEQYKPVATRDTFRYLTEWSYRYGSKGRPSEQTELPDTGQRIDEIDDIITYLNNKITQTVLTVNDVALALELANQIWDDFDEDEHNSVFDSPRYEQVTEILNEVSRFIKMKQPELNWDMLGGTFDAIRNQTQQDVMKEAGKRKILRELNNFESDSIKEYLEQKNH